MAVTSVHVTLSENYRLSDRAVERDLRNAYPYATEIVIERNGDAKYPVVTTVSEDGAVRKYDADTTLGIV